MAGLSADRPSEVVLAARVARQFYLEGVSKIDIADRLGISRFRVARLLDSARDSGLVRIEIGLPGGTPDAGLSAELCSAFVLKHAFVFNSRDDDEVALRRRPRGLSAICDGIAPAERDCLARLGVRAELAGVFIGEDGRPVAAPLDSRMIVTPGRVLERIPFVLSVVWGVAKSQAVCAAIRGDMVHGLVTHASLARALLSQADRPVGVP